MKKLIITGFATSCLSLGVLAQGSINVDASLPPNDPGITTQGANATSTSAATTYYGGTLSLQVWYLTGTTVPGNINNLLNTTGGGQAAAANLVTDGFAEVSTTTLNGSTIGPVSGSIASGSFAFSGNVGLANVPTGANGVLALVGTATSSGVNNGWMGVIAFVNSTGGNPNTTPTPGTPATLAGWGTLNENLVLSQPSASPEPATIAFAALGLGSFLVARRKK